MSDFFRRTVGETIELKIVGVQGLWNTETDPNQLEAALLNLVVNARDAMPNGGKLTIETNNSFIDEQYAKQNADVVAGPYVSISVTDNGVGMDQTTLERAFEPFFSTKGDQTGYRIRSQSGVWICKAVGRICGNRQQGGRRHVSQNLLASNLVGVDRANCCYRHRRCP